MSSKTPRPAAKKTKSALKAGNETNRRRFFSSRQAWNKSKRGLLFSGLVIYVGLAILFFVSIQPNSTNLKIGRFDYRLQIAKTSAQLQKGLGDRSTLPANQGMLFAFDGGAIRCFWMKDMQFPLDIIWLNAGKTVQYIAPNVPPSSYPENFCPPVPAKYVIELNAGQAAKAQMKTGETLHF